MKATFRSNEIAHVWAHQSAPEGKSPSALSFTGEVIYSYSTPMGRIEERNGRRAFILNEGGYSVTTSKHQSQIRGAVPDGFPVFRFSGVSRGHSMDPTGRELFYYAMESASQKLEASKRARKQSMKDSLANSAVRWMESAKEICSFYGLRFKVDEKAIERLSESKARAEKRERIAQAKREKQAMEEQGTAFEAWKQGQQHDYFNARLFPVAFRVEGEELVSTLGARVPTAEARIALRFALHRRGTDWHRNGETCPVGHYQLDAINAQGIVAGCHRISWAEVERVSTLLNP